MPYIINTSSTTSITLNLVQGRVVLKPKGYCELHIADLERARTLYNNKEFNLYVAETKNELDLILNQNSEPKSEIIITEIIGEGEDQATIVNRKPTGFEGQDEIPSSGKIVVADVTLVQNTDKEENESEENQLDENDESNEDDGFVTLDMIPIEEDESLDKNDEDSKESEENQDENPIDEDENDQPSPEELKRAQAIEKVQKQIEEYRSQGNLNDLKDMATKLGVSYVWNTSFDKLAEKIMTHLSIEE